MSTKNLCQVAEAVSTHGDALVAAREVAAGVLEQIGDHPDFVVLFVTPHHRDQAQQILSHVLHALTPDTLVGSTMSGVVGGGQEHLAGPGIALWAVRASGTRVQSYHLRYESESSMVTGWPDFSASASAVMLADPRSFPTELFLRSLRDRERYPALVGGLASGADRFGGNLLFRDDEILTEGAVGFALAGSMGFEPLIAQGTRPVGPVFKVTRAESGVVYSLSGNNAYEELREMMSTLPDEERRRFGRAPHVGIQAIPNRTGEISRDYLTRSVIDIDPETGAISLSGKEGPGLALQFQARDRDSADRELRDVLAMASGFHPDAAGALLFPCTGRGVHLFQESDHDVSMLQHFWKDLPVSGAFAAGEIGPVCGRPYVHGLCASIGLLVPRGE